MEFKLEKELPDYCPVSGRGSGQTQWMIDQLVSAVVSGQPRSFVVGRDMRLSLHFLLPRICQSLEDEGLSVVRKTQRIVEADGSLVVFTSRDLVDRDIRGYRGCGVFWDHFAEERDNFIDEPA